MAANGKNFIWSNLGQNPLEMGVKTFASIKNLNIHVFRPFQLQQKEETNSGYKHNNKVSHGIYNLTFRMLQHTSSEVTVTKSDEI